MYYRRTLHRMQTCVDVLSCELFEKDVCCLVVSTFHRNCVLIFCLLCIIYMIRRRQNVKTRFPWNVLTRRHTSLTNTSLDKTSKHNCMCVVFFHIVSYCVMSYWVVLCRIVLYHVLLYRIVSYCVTFKKITSKSRIISTWFWLSF